MTSKCKLCGEQLVKTGNFSYKIVPAKRIPRKAQQLWKNPGGNKDPSLGGGDATKFHQFLLQRSKPANVMELTCGKCGGVTRMKMQKPGHRKEGTLERGDNKLASPSPSREWRETGSSLKYEKARNKRKFKDSSAGLTIPGSVSSVKEQNHGTKTNPSPGNSKNFKKSVPVSKAQRQRELDNLNKMLFNSKRAKKSGSTLQDFLSSI